MYTMAWRLVVRTVLGADAAPEDPVLIDVKEYGAAGGAGWNANAGEANAFKSERNAVSAGLAMNRRMQSTLKINVRFEVFGQPAGSPEAGNPDIPDNLKAERLYCAADTPQLALLLAIRAANRKAPGVGAETFGRPAFVANDVVPEAFINEPDPPA